VKPAISSRARAPADGVAVPALRARLDELRGSFDKASDATGLIERQYLVAGSSIRLRFAGPALADIVAPAFAHLEETLEESPALTVSIWDSASTGTTRPSLAPADPDAVNADPTNPGPSYFYAEDDLQTLQQPVPDTLTTLAAEDGAAWFWVRDAARLPSWDRAAPLRHLLSWWLGYQGCQQVHGGAVGTESGGVLLVGRGGSGKSTATLATLLEPRLRYTGDDYVALAAGSDPWIHSLYCSGKLHPDQLRRLPHLTPALANSGRLNEEKAIFYINRAFPDQLISGFPLRAVVLPRVSPEPGARVVPTSRATALTALAPSTIFQLHPPKRKALEMMAQLVAEVPAFVLEMGPDVSAVPVAIGGLLEELQGET
jgi:hypothetical protein